MFHGFLRSPGKVRSFVLACKIPLKIPGGNSITSRLPHLACDQKIILCRLALPQSIAGRLLCTLQAGIIKIGAKAVGNVPYTCFLGDEVSISQNMFAAILRQIRQLIQPALV